MSIKLLDADCAINLFERIHGYDCKSYLQHYRTVLTEIVLNELKKGESFHQLPFETYKFTELESKLYSDLESYVVNLGPGEQSVIVCALSLCTNHTCEGDDKIVVLSMDKEAHHVFERTVLKDPAVMKHYPNAKKIIWVKVADLLKKVLSHLMLV